MSDRHSTILSVLLSCCLVFGPAVPVFATEGVQENADEVATTEQATVGDETGSGAAQDVDSEDTSGAENTDGSNTLDGSDGGATVDDSDADGASDEQQVSSEELAESDMDAAYAEETALETQAQEEAKSDEDVLLTAQSTVAEADAFASQHVGTIENGTYAITSSLGSAFAMDVRSASTANGAQIITWTSKVANNQRWTIENVGGGYVTIKSVMSGKYLQAGYDGKAYQVVQNARSTSNRGQLWIVCKESNQYKFVPASDLNRVLVVSGGTNAKSGNTLLSYLENSALTKNKLWNITVTADIQDSQAAAHKNDLSNGIYFFSNSASSSLRLSVAGASLSNGAQINLQNSASKTIQAWTVSHDSKGYVTLVNVQSGRALDVRGGTAAEGTPIIQWTKNSSGPRNQKWIAVKRSDGSYTLYSALTGSKLVLGTTGATASATAKLYVTTGAKTQQWFVSKAPAHFAHLQDVPNGEYLIETALDNSKVLDVVASSKTSGATVKLWTSKLTNNQIWNISHDDAGYVHVTNKNSGLQLAYVSGKIVQSSSSYKWVFEKASGGYRIQDPASGKYLDVSHSNTDNMTNTVILFAKGTGKNQLWNVVSPIIGVNTPIMGVSQITQAQAVRYIKNTYKSLGQNLPKKWRDDGETVEKIVKYFWEEGAAEGVRGDVALAQSIHETGMFQFGGDVIPAQYNFAGIGTTGGGVKGNYFKNARIGIRAQIQHLKAYASTKPLNNACVDPRFNYVNRGCAPTIAGLAKTWAYDPGYAKSITKYLNAMLAS